MKKSSKKDIKSMDVCCRLGAFDKALNNPYNNFIFSKNHEGFVIQYPYGIITIKPTREAVKKLIDLVGEYGLNENNDESILNCCADKNKLQNGGRINWESERYSENIKNKIKLCDWLQDEANATQKTASPKTRNATMLFAVIDGERDKTKELFERTGTNGN